MISKRRTCSLWTLLLIGMIIESAPGCSTSQRSTNALSSTSLGPLLEAMWRAHGGLDNWRRVERVRLKLGLEGEPRDIEVPPLKLEFKSRGCEELLVEDEGGIRRLALRSKDRKEGALDYQLRTVRALFHLPFAFAEPGWEFRIDVFPRDQVEAGPVGFWALPIDLPSPHVGYHITVDPRSRRLGTVVYQVAHPWRRGRLFQVDFRRYRWIDGICVPTEVVHREIRPDPTVIDPGAARVFDPFDPARTSWAPRPSSSRSDGRMVDPPALDERVTWTARLDGIHFVAAQSASDRPEDGAEASEPGLESGPDSGIEKTHGPRS